MEYKIKIKKRTANKIWLIATETIKIVGNKSPEKFVNAALGLACRFQDGSRLIYKLEDKHVTGIADVVGGYICAVLRLSDIEQTEPNKKELFELMEAAESVVKQATKQGYIYPERIKLRLVHSEK